MNGCAAHIGLLRRWTVLAAALLAPCVADAAAGGVDRAEVLKLFAAAEKSTPAAVTAARDKFDALRKHDPSDTRLDYVYGLVLLEQHRYRDAAPWFSKYLSSATGKQDAWAYAAKAFAQLQDRRYREAVETIRGLSGALAGKPNPDDEALAAARFAGQAVGYLAFTRREIVDAAWLADQSAAIQKQLPTECRAAFDEGRLSVSQKLAELQHEQQAKVAAEQAEQDDRKRQVAADLADARDKANEQDEKIQSQEESLNRAQSSLQLVQAELAALQADRDLLSTQILVTQAQMADYLRQAWAQQDRSRPNRIRPSEPLILYSSLQFTLLRLNRQAIEIDRNLLALRSRAAELGGKGARAAQSIATSEAIARRHEKVATIADKQLRRYEAPAKPRPTGPTGKALQLSSYLDFPEAEEQQRVLGWFAR